MCADCKRIFFTDPPALSGFNTYGTTRRPCATPCLPGSPDVEISQMAARSLYRRLLKAGIEIYEYQPQILHAKLVIIDGITYVGSSNFDIRSLNLNYRIDVAFRR